jgi:hypothetical protein
MKKLISAVTSLCMAATMVSAVVPATVGAADATKGFSIKTYNPDKPGISDGSSKVTVTKDQLANGDYTFPAAVYLTEATNGGTGSFSLNLSTNSPDIKFALRSPNKSYFDDERTFTISSGEAKTDCYISFGGKYDKVNGYDSAGRYVFGVDESQSKAGTDNYFLGLTWNNDGEQYKWAGTKSDDYPVYVFDVTVPKGTPAGTYDIDFLHYDTDDRADVTVMTPLVEAYRASDSDPAAKYSIEDSNLTLNKMTIEVQGDTPVATTTTTQAQPQPTTTTTTVTTPVGNADFNFSIVDENGQSTAKVKAGQEVLVNVNVNAGSNTCAGMDAQFDLGGLDMTTVVNKSKALGNAKVKDNKTEGRISIIATDEETGDPVAVKNGSAAVQFYVTIPQDAANGKEYEIGMVNSELKIFKQGGSGDKYTGAWTPLKLVVDNGDEPVTTQDQPQPTTTTTTVTTSVANADFNFSIVDENGQSAANVNPGQEVLVNVNVNAGSNTCAGMDAQFDLGGLDMETVVNKSKALGNAKVKDNKAEGRISIIATDEETGDPVAVKNGSAAVQFYVTIPQDAAAGTTYKIDMVASELKIFKQGGSGDKYTGAWTPLTLTVGAPVTSTTTDVTTTTTTVTTTTTTVTEPQPTTTTTNPNPGTKLVPTWGDVNCDGSVNVADVVVLNRYLNNPTYPVSDQGKVNGDVLDPQDKTGAAVDPAGVRLTAADSETILKSIVELVTLPQ